MLEKFNSGDILADLYLSFRPVGTQNTANLLKLIALRLAS